MCLDYENDSDFARGFGILRKMHSLRDRVFFVFPRIHSALMTIDVLRQIAKVSHETGVLTCKIIDTELQSYEVRIRGHLATLDMLEKKGGAAVKLVSHAL